MAPFPFLLRMCKLTLSETSLVDIKMLQPELVDNQLASFSSLIVSFVANIKGWVISDKKFKWDPNPITKQSSKGYNCCSNVMSSFWSMLHSKEISFYFNKKPVF